MQVWAQRVFGSLVCLVATVGLMPDLAVAEVPVAPDVAEPGSIEAIASSTSDPRFVSPWVAYVPGGRWGDRHTDVTPGQRTQRKPKKKTIAEHGTDLCLRCPAPPQMRCHLTCHPGSEDAGMTTKDWWLGTKGL